MLIYTCFAFLFLIYLLVGLNCIPFVKSSENIKFHKYVLVFGAGVDKSGKPSDILADRVNTGIALIKKGKSEFIIMSGGITETQAMVKMAKAEGIPGSKILMDTGGNSTLDSLKNLRAIYRHKGVVLVSQFFHLPRAIFLANILGIRTKAVIAQGYSFSFPKIAYWSFRELAAIPYNLFKVALRPREISREKDCL